MWEPLPTDVADWMGMDDRLRVHEPIVIEEAALRLLAARATDSTAA